MNGFRGVWPVLPTPMDPAARFCERDVAALVRWGMQGRVAGIVALGLASEALQLEIDERLPVAEAFLREAQGKAPVIIGVTAADTASACRLAEHAARHGAAVLLAAPPTGGSPARQALVRHYAEIARAAGACPLMVQDAPQFVGSEIDAELAAELRAGCPTIAAFKSEGVPAGLRTRRLVQALAGARIGVFGGMAGLQSIEVYAAGAVGMLPGAECPAEHAELHHLWFAGERAAAEALYRKILPLLSFKMQSLPFLVAATKALLHERGVLSSERARISEPLDQWSRAALLRHWQQCIGSAAIGPTAE